ncbi:MAG: ABC transporter ATP-binding protein [Desulfomonile tiedjei]|nr:ABC transporter ATP-binding protein [Desulfomonile tiedjei]
MPVKPGNGKILVISDLYKSYGDKAILDNVDLCVTAGELCTIVGPSGCGKTTLLRIILGEELSSKGEVLINGEPVGFPGPERGIVYQKYSLFPHLTVLENVMLGKTLSAGFLAGLLRRNGFREEAMYFLEKVKLSEHWAKFPHELSGGMQQRAAIAQSLIMKPHILLMDEPFGALDPGTREQMQLFLLELWEEFEMTVFFVTHDLEEAVFLGTRIIVLSQYYRDGRHVAPNHRGARIVSDYPLARRATSTVVKETAEFGRLIQQIRREGFDPQYCQHVSEFNLRHPDSFQTLSEEEMERN